MNKFTGFVIKEFRHIFRDRKTLLILFGMPVMQMMIFGYIISNEIKNVNIGFLDYSNDVSTLQIRSKLLSSEYFRGGELLSSEKDIEAAFRQGRLKEVVIFCQDFDKKRIRGEQPSVRLVTDASDANTANLISLYTSGIILTWFAQQHQNQTAPLITAESRMMFNQDLRSVFMFVPGTMAMILILISALMTSISIVREKELGTMEILLASPLRPAHIILGKVTPYVLLSFINAISILLLSYTVFGLPVNGSVLLILGESMLYIILSLSIGIFISTITSSQLTAMLLSMVALMLPTILLSGFIFPIENMPKILQWLCQAMPPRWFISILKSVMLKGNSFMYVWKETLVLASMTLFFILLSIKKFKVRLETK